MFAVQVCRGSSGMRSLILLRPVFYGGAGVRGGLSDIFKKMYLNSQPVVLRRFWSCYAWSSETSSLLIFSGQGEILRMRTEQRVRIIVEVETGMDCAESAVIVEALPVSGDPIVVDLNGFVTAMSSSEQWAELSSRFFANASPQR